VPEVEPVDAAERLADDADPHTLLIQQHLRHSGHRRINARHKANSVSQSSGVSMEYTFFSPIERAPVVRNL
jgi:hypothetical protein